MRVGKCIGRTVKVLCAFDKTIGVIQGSGSHTQRSSKEDVLKVLQQLTEKSVFQNIGSRFHQNFSNFMLRQLNMVTLQQWMSEQMKKLRTYQ